MTAPIRYNLFSVVATLETEGGEEGGGVLSLCMAVVV